MLSSNINITNPRTGQLAGFFISLLLLVLLLGQGCMTAPQTNLLLQQSTKLPAAHEIENVPFFPQEDYYCGPTTLAEILNFYDRDIEPVTVAPSLFIPERRGSLQIEMVASIRQYGMLGYAEQGNLNQLLALISEDIPVIVLQNKRLSWYPLWHYALVIGYDLEAQTVILHTGVNEHRIVSMELFENTWRKGNYWLLAALPPEDGSDHFDPFVYVSAARDLIQVGQEQAGVTALKTASIQWSDYWLSYFLLGNHFLQTNPQGALNWFKQGAQAGSDETSFLNNYAYALLFNDCAPQALEIIQRATLLDPDNAALKDSLAEIRQNQSGTQAELNGQSASCSI
jgi:hypothetical protein